MTGNWFWQKRHKNLCRSGVYPMGWSRYRKHKYFFLGLKKVKRWPTTLCMHVGQGKIKYDHTQIVAHIQISGFGLKNKMYRFSYIPEYLVLYWPCCCLNVCISFGDSDNWIIWMSPWHVADIRVLPSGVIFNTWAGEISEGDTFTFRNDSCGDSNSTSSCRRNW